MQETKTTTGLILQGSCPEDLAKYSHNDLREFFRAYGAIQFLGFGLGTQAFVEFTEKFGGKFLPYIVGAYTREAVSTDQTVVKVNSGEVAISLHGEQHYKKHQADLIWFYCETPTTQGGATLICDGVEIYKKLSETAKKFLETQKIKYIRWMSDGFWQKIFKADHPLKVKLICEHEGLILEEFPNKSIRTQYVTSPLVSTRFGHGPAFINNLMVVYFDQENLPPEMRALTTSEVFLENGKALPKDLMEEVKEVSTAITHPVKWSAGDFILLDNQRFMHGRESFYGQTQRRVITRMAKLL